MAINPDECRAYTRGEIVPIIFEVYTESGLPFSLVDTLDEENDRSAYCEVRNAEHVLLKTLGVKMIDDQPARKKLLCSWDTSTYSTDYYLLQLWAQINITGDVDEQGMLVVEAKLASEELTRYIRD